jgi:hypothetical protein
MIAINQGKLLIENTRRDWQELFPSGGPYGEGYESGFMDALEWFIMEYDIRIIKDIDEEIT